ncbi:MAG: amidohydrolase [Rhodobacter sp.]|uniref:M20 aminoacylase family protein n=1 Tax=Pararhodobacter sp. TaxID=2127056 RepID=UPI001D4DBD27|nr:M20 aminoacylase family protein [Pararhodobacter sp.]MCB1346217.1 amidohydrolase [Paracoccaceae bacterium]MCC0074432.1 amidohydrolase [Rhodobacter sp.]HPD91412.1 M20 aminoacylase family protein [Pararhodobacter sp.]
MPVRNRLAEMHPEITAWRRDLHEHPELLYDLPRTSALVARRLEAFGCDEVVPGIGRSGVVGVIRGRRTDSGKVTLFRADMDALPINEITGLDFASKTEGKMHACGHDGHTAILLGAAKYLAETRNFDGTVVLAFQPAEEGGAGGKAMVDDGLMDRWGVQEVYGLHNMPGLPTGSFAIREGALLASADEFTVTVTGRGGHAAVPHMAIDTTLVASHIVVALQSIVARNMDPLGAVVVTVGSFHTDSVASNVIAHTVTLQGTVRTLDPALRQLAHDRIMDLVPATAQAYGATAEIRYDWGYPVTVNHPEQTAFAADCAEEVAGACDRNVKPAMPAEDFAYMLEARPGAYMLLGNGDTPMCHHPAYRFDDDAIPAGCSWFVTLAERRMPLE